MADWKATAQLLLDERLACPIDCYDVQPGHDCKCRDAVETALSAAYAEGAMEEREDNCRAVCAAAYAAGREEEREIGKVADFLIEEIIDREGREGLTDFDFAEQAIRLAQDCRERIHAIRARGASHD